MLWRWRLGRGNGTWKNFDAKGEQEVELAFQRGHPTVQLTFFNPRLQQHVVYKYDLNKMQQVPPRARLTRCQAAEYTRGALVVHEDNVVRDQPSLQCCIGPAVSVHFVKHLALRRSIHRQASSAGSSASFSSPSPPRALLPHHITPTPRSTTVACHLQP